MTVNGQHIVRLEFTSAFEMLDFVQVVSDHMARDIGLDEDSLHWVSVAIRESVINAIKHGNRNDSSKHVFIEFETATRSDVPELAIRVAGSSSSATSWTTCSSSARRKAGWRFAWSSACSRPPEWRSTRSS